MKHLPALLLCACLLSTLFVLPAAADINVFSNPNFDSELSYWSTSTSGSGSTYESSIYVADDAARLYVSSNSVYYESYAKISQTVDLTGVSNVQLNTDVISYSSTSTYGRLIVQVDGSSVASWTMGELGDYVHADVSGYSGQHEVTFMLYVTGSSETGNSMGRQYCQVAIDSIYGGAPSACTVTGISVSPTTPNAGTAAEITFSYTYPGSLDYPGSTGVQSINFIVDGVTYGIDLYGKSSPVTTTYTFPTAGTQTIYAYGMGPQDSTGYYTQTVTVLPAKPAGLSLSSTPADGIIEVGDSITFVASASSGGSVTSWTWDFGDGSAETTTTTATATHTYTETGSYDVTITANGPGGSTSYTKTAAVYVGETVITLDKTPAIYYIGEDTEIQATYSITPFDSEKAYTMEFWRLNDDYSLNSRIVSIPLSAGSGTESISLTGITTNNYYAVYLVVDGGQIASQICTVRYNGSTLTVNILSGNAPLTASTTVQLQDSGGNVLATQTTNTGSTLFAPVTNGNTYTVIANATGYKTVSSTVTISGDTTVDLDVGGAVVSGIGAQYEPITATWIVYNEHGEMLPGVVVTAVGIETSTSIGLLNSLYNMIFGEQLITEPQTLTTDSRGQVTFLAIPNTQYKLTFSYAGQTWEKTYNIGSSKPSYTVKLTTGAQQGDISKDLTISVQASGGLINVNYTDSTQTTTLVQITLLDADRNQVDVWSAPTQSAAITFTITDYAGKEYFVIINAANSHGNYEREYPVFFNGPRLDLGLPDGLLIWIALISAVALGGVFAGINVSMGALAVSIYMWLMYAIGWLWQIEDNIGTVGLTLSLMVASIVSIMFMMAEAR